MTESVANSAQDFKKEVDQGERFEFGDNWKNFLETINDTRISCAEESLKQLLDGFDLDGKTFLDIGSGSGLSSLVARRSGAVVRSFDYDPQSVECTKAIKAKYKSGDTQWSISRGDALNSEFMNELGQFDVVHSWGVLHHTGSMWKAIDHAIGNCRPGGLLILALYNDQGWISRVWKMIKKVYCSLPSFLRFTIVYPVAFLTWGPTLIKDVLTSFSFKSWKEYEKNRGMSPWHDIIDWVGGYPFEVCEPMSFIEQMKEKGFDCIKLQRGKGLACNEFVFLKEKDS